VVICYLAYPTSLRLQSANAIQTWTTLRELRRLAPDTLALIPRKGREPSRFGELGAVHLPRPGIGRLSRIYKTTLLYYLEHSAWAWMCLAYLLLERLRGRRYDLIYVRQIVIAAWWAGLLGRLYGARVVYEAHDWESSNPSRAKERWAQGLVHLLDRAALTRSDAVVSLTEHFVSELRRIGWMPRRWAVIPDAFDDTVYRPVERDMARTALALPRDSLIVGYAGMTFAHRGLDRLVRAFASAELPPEALLIFVGGRPREVDELQRLADELGVLASVRFVEPQPQKAVAHYLAASDILVVPDTVTDVTASPLKLFEYMAMARPVVCLDIPALREVIDEHAARFVRRGDIADLAAALEELAFDPQRRAGMGQAARQQAQAWTYAQRAQRMLDLAAEVNDPRIHANTRE